MNAAQRAKLERAGFKIGSSDEFLDLSDVESKLIDFRVRLADLLKSRRVEVALTHPQLARRLAVRTSLTVKMEAASPEVSFELLLRAVLTVGATSKDLATAFGTRNSNVGLRRTRHPC